MSENPSDFWMFHIYLKRVNEMEHVNLTTSKLLMWGYRPQPTHALNLIFLFLTRNSDLWH